MLGALLAGWWLFGPPLAGPRWWWPFARTEWTPAEATFTARRHAGAIDRAMAALLRVVRQPGSYVVELPEIGRGEKAV
jgi:hypothetical protein